MLIIIIQEQPQVNMGNTFCQSTPEEPVQNQLVGNASFRNCKLSIIYGDPMHVSADVLVRFTHTEELNLKNGDIYHQPQFENQLIKDLSYVKIPFYFDHGTDQGQLFNLYQIYLTLFNTINGDVISIEDPLTQRNPIPKQYNAEILIRALLSYIFSEPKVEKRYKIVCNSVQSAKFMRYELDKLSEEAKDAEVFKKQMTKFQYFINPTESFIVRQQEDIEKNKALYSQIGDDSEMRHKLGETAQNTSDF